MNDKTDMNGQHRDDREEIRNSSMSDGNTDDRGNRDHRQDNDGMHGGNVGGSAYERPQASGDAERYGSQEPQGCGCGCHDRNDADKRDSDKKREQQNSDSIHAGPTQQR